MEVAKRILKFCQVSNHKDETIRNLIESCFIEWPIENIFAVFMDNAFANEVVLPYIIRRLKSWNGCFLEC